MSKRFRRRSLGDNRSEAGRRLWLLLIERRWTPADLTRELEMDTGYVSRLLNADRRAGLEVAVQIAERFPEIAVPLWRTPPMEPFVLADLRKRLEAALAEAPEAPPVSSRRVPQAKRPKLARTGS